MNARQRRKNRRKLSRQFGVHVPPGHHIRLEPQRVKYESCGNAHTAAMYPVAIEYDVLVVPDISDSKAA